jgi:hypothetical protein
LLDHLSDINLDLNFLGLDEEKTYNEAIEDEVPEIPEKEIVVKK